MTSYDHFDHAVAACPYDAWREFRTQPVTHSDTYGGFEILARYADVVAAATNPTVFTSTRGIATPKVPLPPMIPIELDPPEHQKYRRLINPKFTKDSLAAMEPSIRALARGLIDTFTGASEVEVCSAFTEPFPQQVALVLFGLPPSDQEQLAGWIDALSSFQDGSETDAGPALFGYVMETIARRRSEPPLDDLLGALLSGQVDGRPLADDEVARTMIILLFGGLHTTTSALNGMLVWLADHPTDRERLVADPSVVPTAIEEIVRYTTPASHITRETTTATEVGGCPVPADTRVMLIFGSANRDPEAFAQPDELLLDRSPNRHVGFGMGPHRCVGMALARIMLQVAIEELLPVLGDFRVKPGAELRWLGGQARGIRFLPLVIPADG